MKVTVTPRVVSGTDRGGENLFLVFAAEGEISDTFTVELGEGVPDWEVGENYDEDEDGNPTPESELSCCTGHYEFEWKGTLKQLAQLAVEAGCQNEANWQWCGPVSGPPVKRFRHEHYVCGNAE